MFQNTFLSALVALKLASGTAACGLHATDGNTPVANHRRSQSEPRTRTAIENVRVFDGWHFRLAQTVCFDYGYIVDTDGCDGAVTIVNGTGKFLIPGLIDSHLHLTDVQSLEDFTSYGCTTAMHTNCQNYTQCAINSDQPGLTSYIHAGMSAVGNGSHHQMQSPNRAPGTIIYPDTNVTEFTEWQFNNGSSFHKITAETNGPSLEQQVEMIRVAHYEYGKQTMTHASDITAYHQAADSVTDGIQHVPDDGILDAATLQKIKSQNQYVTPTINVFKYAYANPTLLQGYFGVQPGSNRTLAHALANAKLIYEAGIPMMAGTDAVGPIKVNGTVITVPFGLTMHYELENLVQVVGMSPAEAINAATREAAKWHRITDRGSIEVGKKADLLLLNSNPLVNISNTQDIERVWAAGIEVARVVKLA